MSFENLKYEVTEQKVGIITLNRPHAMNSMSYELYMELEDAVRFSEARVLIITGEGRAFCAGDDVKQILGGTQGPPKESIARGRRTYGLTAAAEAMLYSDIPIIAAVNGPAVGWGMEIALMADIRIASDRAKFGELFVVRGLCCDAAGLGRLAQIVGRETAAELLFTGEVIDADRARELRLVSRVVAHDDLMSTALTLANKIAANPPLAVKSIKAGLRRTLDPDWRDVGSWAIAQITTLRKTEDSIESVRSFLEKRTPTFVGR